MNCGCGVPPAGLSPEECGYFPVGDKKVGILNSSPEAVRQTIKNVRDGIHTHPIPLTGYKDDGKPWYPITAEEFRKLLGDEDIPVFSGVDRP